MRSPLLALLLFSSAAVAQPHRPSVRDLTTVERQKDDFYGAIAGRERVTATWTVSPIAVELGGDITLTLTVANAANPHELTRPPLADRDEFKRLFSVVADLPGPPPAPTATAAVFRYRVRPRAAGAFEVPEVTYLYYAKRAAANRRFQTAFVEAVPFTVTKPVAKSAVAVPLDGPPRFFALRSNGPFARSGGPGACGWFVLVVVAAVGGLGWVVVWRRVFPDAARLAKIRRTRAVRVALDRLRKATTSADPTAATAAVFRGYLAARFGVPSAAQTPPEVADALRQVGVDVGRVADAEGLLRGCDAVRFAGSGDTAVSPATAVMLIERWEGIRG
jgi:hypothetical protein